MIYCKPVMNEFLVERSTLLNQYTIASSADITGVTGCGGQGGGCDEGDDDNDIAGAVLFLCVEGVSSNADLVSGVTIGVNIDCNEGTDDFSLPFPACSVAADDAQSICPSGSLGITCAQTFNCDEFEVCQDNGGELEEDDGPNFFTVNGHSCTNVLDVFGDH